MMQKTWIVIVTALAIAVPVSAAAAKEKSFAEREAKQLINCIGTNAQKISMQQGDPEFLARTLLIICDRERAALLQAYTGKYGVRRGREIFRQARFDETNVEFGAAIILKRRID